MNHWSDDTIAAIATAPGEAGLCVVRMSGTNALVVADRVFRGKSRPSHCSSHTVHYGRIVDPDNNEIIDEVLLTVMRAPRTYTSENTAEISGHGGYRPGLRILQTLIQHGARLAHPGEFTKRAFLNGRLDLLQAEAVAEIIRSRTDAGVRAAIRQLEGGFSQKINALRDRLIDLLALVEVGLDFTEDGIEEIGYEHLHIITTQILDDLNQFIINANQGRILRDGARLAIIGRPNVGKSSLLNALLQQNRAIVDPTPGTTRDTIEETIDVYGIPVTLVDTAGLHQPSDSIEAQGVERTQKELQSADLLLWIIDGTEKAQHEDEWIYKHIDLSKVMAVVNKIDRPLQIDLNSFSHFHAFNWNHISATHGIGIDDLKKNIYNRLSHNSNLFESEALVNARHREKLNNALNGIKRVMTMMEKNIGQEVLAIELRDVTRNLGDIIGKDIDDDILNRIFSKFCIGK